MGTGQQQQLATSEPVVVPGRDTRDNQAMADADQWKPEQLRAARLRAGLSQAELGRALGVRTNTVGEWEQPTGAAPRIHRYGPIADALGIDVAVLLGDQWRSELTATRLEQGMTQLELAKRSGVPRQTIQSVEAGRFDLSWAAAQKIAAVWGIDPGKLTQRR